MTAYYAGVIFIPLLGVVKKEYIAKSIHVAEEKFGFTKVKLFVLLGFFFVVFQIIWRVMFEMIIGYFQMRDYLQQLAG